MMKVSLQKKVKKKAKPKKFTGKGLKIVDEDSFGLGYNPPSDSDNENVEDLPQIAAVVDERPVEVQVLESFNEGKWKRLDDGVRESSRRDSDSDDSLPRMGKSSDRDISPPRRRNKNSDDVSPPRRRRNSDDLSPPRKQKNSSNYSPRRRRNSGNFSPPSKRTESKMSPPRRRKNSDDISPPRRRRKSSDNTPPRKPKNFNSSPPRRHKNSDDDISLPRRQRKSSDENPRNSRQTRDISTSRKHSSSTHISASSRDRRMSSASKTNSKHQSPSLRRRRSSGSLTPPRQKLRSNSPSHVRRQNSHNRGSDISPLRKTDLSPLRQRDDKRRDRHLIRPEILDDSNEDGKSKTTLDGKRAGLQKAVALRDELLEFRQRENEMFEMLPDEVSGRHAKAVKRDRRTEEEIAKEAEKEKKDVERKEQYNKWGKGVKQVEEQKEKVRSALHEMSKPLARYKDDDDLDDHLKNQDRVGDPMLEYLSAKRQKTKGPDKPKYNGPPPPPNRFRVPPGFRWDGVDRSNGYEKEWFNRINAKKALEEEAYKWSVEDL